MFGKIWFVAGLCVILCFGVEAKVKLPALVADGMVLQREQELTLWGEADAGEEVFVTFLSKNYRTLADGKGNWILTLPSMKAGGPYTMTINDIELKDILIGDVWLCSGQSNMETPLSRVMDLYADEILAYSNTKIRHVKLPMDYNFHSPQSDTKPAAWTPLTPEYIRSLTAVPYFFGKFLYEETGVPVGLINSSVGGSPAEAWISEEGLKAFPHYINEKKICESDEYVRQVQQLQQESGQRWFDVLNAGDPGLKEGWKEPAFDDSGWETTDLFADWGTDGNGLPINGSFWFRKTVDIPDSLAGQEAILRLGCIVDADSVFINGAFAGTTAYQYPPRKYTLPAGLLKAGENQLTIRLISQAGPPHFVQEKPYKIVFSGGEEISLEGDWRYRLANRMPASEGGIAFQYKPAGLYNAMIAPLRNWKLKGVVWYQAESNASRYAEYESLFTALVADWRKEWKRPELPFLFVQLPNFLPNYPGESQWAAMRNVQRKLSHSLPNSGMAVTIDIGEWNDVHPLNKKDVGYRLMLQAMRLVYGKKTLIADGPVYESYEIKDNKMVLSFREGTDDFLPVDTLGSFEVAGADGVFRPAKATIENNKNKIIVWNETVANPVAARYAWANSPVNANLRNRAGLPASPFRTSPPHAEDGSRLWLRMDANTHADVTANRKGAPIDIALKELQTQWTGDAPVRLLVTDSKEIKALGNEGYAITGSRSTGITIQASAGQGLLYGAYHLLRLQQTGQDAGALQITESPKYSLRILNHWDNLDGTIERGYAGHSLWKWDELPATLSPRYEAYARANASIGINGTVLNNVNASPAILNSDYLRKVKALADIFRPYGLKVYLSVNFSSPKVLGGLASSDPLLPEVAGWWAKKVKEIYALIPDFGGFLVKANSEGQPGPQDYGRTHAEGANMLADALKPYGGIVMWRAFVYAPDSDDRAKQAYNEFVPLDGQFRDNVIVQVKNGPVDFQPREPFNPLFGAMEKTPLMVEFQITQEYLGFSNHLAYLPTLFKEFFVTSQATLSAIAGVANIGEDTNWTGHHFAQANWYGFGRLAWDNTLTPEQIADEWLRMTFSDHPLFLEKTKDIMLASREAVVNYMMPLGLHHIFAEGHHYGPQPWYDSAPRPDWTCTYYHKADTFGLGFDRTATGSNAVAQYHSPLREIYADRSQCPEAYLLWFHHLPWNYTMKSGRTLWEELCYHYDAGVKSVRNFQREWDSLEAVVDSQRFADVQYKLKIQAHDAVWWKDACLLYFQTFSRMPIPCDIEQPVHDLEELKKIRLDMKHHN